MELQGEWEYFIVNLFLLSVGGTGFGGMKVNYTIVKDYCKKHFVEHLEVYQLLRRIVGEVNER